ncbi:MAG: presqualene diphosphate synthase HpnD [Sphingomonadaceae bacterium]|nr:presqualene diphosphate synthase HpnD [Sphingomonadaceae bacterium]
MSRLDDPAKRGKIAKSSFYAGMRVLPKAEREAMFAIYAFCRDVDDIADDQCHAAAAREAELDGWAADVRALYAGGPPGRAGYLADAVARFHLAEADFHAVIDGMRMDLAADIVAPDWTTLDLYCDRVASAVGRLSVKVFGMEDEPGRVLAHHLGRALQLTNILRDIDEDAGIGRLYLPREALERAGVRLDGAAPGRAGTLAIAADPALDHAARQVASTARAHFAEATRVLRARPRGHLIAPRLMEIVYSDILTRMERQGWTPPRRRVATNKSRLLRKLLLLKLGF